MQIREISWLKFDQILSNWGTSWRVYECRLRRAFITRFLLRKPKAIDGRLGGGVI